MLPNRFSAALEEQILNPIKIVMKQIAFLSLFLLSIFSAEVLQADDPYSKIVRIDQRSIELLTVNEIELRILELGYELAPIENLYPRLAQFTSFLIGFGLASATFVKLRMKTSGLIAVAVTGISGGLSHLLFDDVSSEAGTWGVTGSLVVFGFLLWFGGINTLY